MKMIQVNDNEWVSKDAVQYVSYDNNSAYVYLREGFGRGALHLYRPRGGKTHAEQVASFVEELNRP